MQSVARQKADWMKMSLCYRILRCGQGRPPEATGGQAFSLLKLMIIAFVSNPREVRTWD